MIGTEIDEEDVKTAEDNIARNGLEGKIRILRNRDEKTIFKPVLAGDGDGAGDVLTFTMSNPPFYGSKEEAGPHPQPGRRHEVATEGGEVAFVRTMIQESRTFGAKGARLYTTMLGHKKSLGPLKGFLAGAPDIKQFASSEFCQGRIMRWSLGWTFEPDFDIKGQQSTFKQEKAKKILKNPFVIPLDEPGLYGIRNSLDALEKVKGYLNDLEADPVTVQQCNEGVATVRFKLYEATWRHQRRKRRQDLGVRPPDAKKARTDHQELLLNVTLVSRFEEGKILLEMNCEEGSSLGRGGLYELVQYFRNRLASP